MFSARYAGENATDEENCLKLLEKMKGVKNRNAAFHCVLSVAVPSGPALTYEAQCHGIITESFQGSGGFGYDPLFFYPEPRPTEQVSAEALRQIITYSNETFQRGIGQRFRVVDRAGPGVVQLRAAVSAIAAQGEGLKPYQYVPIAFVATMAASAATGAPQRAFIVFEIEGTDSVSGELLAMRVRVGTGERLTRIGGQQVITLESVKPLVDELAGIAFPELAPHVKPK